MPSRTIPYVNLVEPHRRLRAELLAAVDGVLSSAQFILGDKVREFEERFAERCGVRHAIGLSSGTDALILALRALGIGQGDEVITAPNSFVATASAIVLSGARPVFVDVGDDYNIDPAGIPKAITDRTRAIMPVHLTGLPADMEAIRELAERHALAVVEDAAQSVLAEYRGRPTGALGTVGCFSLHPLKTLNACGDAGMATTDDPELAERIRLLRNLGLKTRDECVAWSANHRLDTLQAAMLLVKLEHVDAWTEARRRHAARYREGLAEVPGLRLPVEPEGRRGVYHTFVVQARDREGLRRHLAERGIGTAVHYPIPIHLQPVGRGLGYGPGNFPVAEAQAEGILSLPVYPELSDDDVDYVSAAVREFYASRRGADAVRA